jgi:hypothetical protein
LYSKSKEEEFVVFELLLDCEKGRLSCVCFVLSVKELLLEECMFFRFNVSLENKLDEMDAALFLLGEEKFFEIGKLVNIISSSINPSVNPRVEYS